VSKPGHLALHHHSSSQPCNPHQSIPWWREVDDERTELLQKGSFFLLEKKGQEMTGKEAKPGIRSQNRFLKTQRSKRKVVSKRQSPPHATSNL